MPLNCDSRKEFDTFEEAIPQQTYTELDKWFDCVTAAVRRMVPGIFDNVDLNEAHKQLLQRAKDDRS